MEGFEGFTLVDGGVAVIVILSALLAYARGFVREVMSIVGWIAAAIVAFIFAPQVEPVIKEAPVVGEFIADSCELSIIAAFAAVFAVALLVVSFFTPLFSSLVQRSALGGLDQVLGFVFGVVRGVLLVAVAFFVYQTALSAQKVDMIEDSRSKVVFNQMTDKIAERNPEEALGWVTRQYEELVGSCGAAQQTELPPLEAPAN